MENACFPRRRLSNVCEKNSFVYIRDGDDMKRYPLPSRLRRILKLLEKAEPLPDQTDVCWSGPFFISRRGKWHPSHFALYNGTLYCRLFIPPVSYGASWKLGSNDMEFERVFSGGDYGNDANLWKWALPQVERRLKSAVDNFSRYNRHVERHLPLSCRSGKIMRRLTWPKNIKSAIPARLIRALENVLRETKDRPLLRKMTLAQYLDTAAVAYDAAFKELRSFSPCEKYRKKADGRDGGMLNLPLHDGKAFSRWFRLQKWAGCHPWEIVFGHPHGIMISPRYHEESDRWSYRMWVDALGWYAPAARMAIALGRCWIPFELQDEKNVLDALKGIDEVDVGPALYMTHYDDLKEQRPDALSDIRWDPIALLIPITPAQRERIAWAARPNGR
ncbi:MAG: hypothetical protein A2Z34_12135 [Planctomycetes bacterium RBG_16_59_8]|nr:MAG: hypothetical protein A2Z34_12135 [Planctomycetes bacterium RBG_16_59_8]